MVVLRVLFLHVALKVDLRIAFERLCQIDGHRHPEARRRLAGQSTPRLRDGPHKQHPLHDEHRGQKGDDADRDSPVETAVPSRAHDVKKC